MTEEEIIKGCIQKKLGCQHILFKKYAGRLMTICHRYAIDVPEAEDMLQEGFIRVFDMIKQYRFEGSFEGWIKKIFINICLRTIQKRKIQYQELQFIEMIEDVQPHILSALTEKELLKMISKLPDGYRMVFNLYIIDGYSHEEIAALLGIEAVTSRSQLAKARKMLQKQLLSNQKIPLDER